jgi:hypothetical protein
VIHYCTYFDRNYLTRAMALHGSLVRHSPPFTLWALCFDDDTYAALEALQLAGVEPIRLAELEAADPELVEVKGSRTTIEYYFTCSPSLPRYVMREHSEVQLITYLDADLLFYSSPQKIFEELGDGSVVIVPHRFPEHLRHLEVYGTFNVGLLSFRNDARGRAVLERWREQCLEWCFDRVEDGRFADQGYLDAWPGQPGVVVLQDPGAGLAPWNFMRYRIEPKAEPPLVDGGPLIFYHFQGVRAIRPGLWDIGLDTYGFMDPALRNRLYRRYIGELKSAEHVLRSRISGHRVWASSSRYAGYTWREVVGKIRRGQVVVSLGVAASAWGPLRRDA